ncbi:hypothetical protein, partial [Flavobacterium sp.]|uniref:hypothetical protein n=1 Tax=Flavobacterium sp. TaxID=239 RepID=UPI00391CDBAC
KIYKLNWMTPLSWSFFLLINDQNLFRFIIVQKNQFQSNTKAQVIPVFCQCYFPFSVLCSGLEGNDRLCPTLKVKAKR